MYIFYELTFAVSLALSILYVLIWNKHYDINISAIFTLIPIANIGYLFLSLATTIPEATICNKIIYLGGCFLTFFITMSVWNLCNIKVSRYIRFLLFALSALMYILVLTIGYRHRACVFLCSCSGVSAYRSYDNRLYSNQEDAKFQDGYASFDYSRISGFCGLLRQQSVRKKNRCYAFNLRSGADCLSFDCKKNVALQYKRNGC